MHKITKGLKKKKKGKKSKHKEDDLFKPEELEAYRQQHAATNEEGEGKGQNEEWRKFLDLTSGVDDILKKTQGDLDRIKSTSFFQRVPPPSELKKQQKPRDQEDSEVEETEEFNKTTEENRTVVQLPQKEEEPKNLGIVDISESESEDEDEDDIFDTAYIDSIAAGEVKLAYIPESPTDDNQGDDPFDTSYAERAILGPITERKGKKLVPLGAAVEVLTGRAQIPSCATQKPNRRQIFKQHDLLLGSFDTNTNTIVVEKLSPEEIKKTLLDDDAPLPLVEEPIDLSKNLSQIAITPVVETQPDNFTLNKINDNKVKTLVEDEDDAEFALLAAESLTKTSATVVIDNLPTSLPEVIPEDSWAAFEQEKFDNKHFEDEEKVEKEAVQEEDDPFDTSFATNILPGKAELKVIESEILNEDIELNTIKTDNKIIEIINRVSIKINEPDSFVDFERVSESDLNLIKPIHRDLLGGSNTDLSNLNDQPLKPAEKVDENYIEYCDPFDTTIVETVKLPGTTELKFLERELLGDIKTKSSLSDDEFDPRADEKSSYIPKERTLSRPDILNIAPVKTVSFDVPDTESELLVESIKSTKPVTPFYVRKSSIPKDDFEEDIETDPFDTSFVSDTAVPGKNELKLIENELFDPVINSNLTLNDPDFDPRDENKVKIHQIVHDIKEILKVKPEAEKPRVSIDLLSVDHEDDGVKALTPIADTDTKEEIYEDPFDTSSIAINILPGKTELKLLETELLLSNSEADKGKLTHILDDYSDALIAAPLSPQTSTFEVEPKDSDDFDPFDTSIASNIVPGKAELKVLENELL